MTAAIEGELARGELIILRAKTLDDAQQDYAWRRDPELAKNRVNLLTLHSTKGLEFSRVYIVGVEDAQLPGSAPGKEPSKSEIEEGRRLLYVGMTRAKDRLVLTRAEERKGLPGGGERYLREMGLGKTVGQ